MTTLSQRSTINTQRCSDVDTTTHNILWKLRVTTYKSFLKDRSNFTPGRNLTCDRPLKATLNEYNFGRVKVWDLVILHQVHEMLKMSMSPFAIIFLFLTFLEISFTGQASQSS